MTSHTQQTLAHIDEALETRVSTLWGLSDMAFYLGSKTQEEACAQDVIRAIQSLADDPQHSVMTGILCLADINGQETKNSILREKSHNAIFSAIEKEPDPKAQLLMLLSVASRIQNGRGNKKYTPATKEAAQRFNTMLEKTIPDVAERQEFCHNSLAFVEELPTETFHNTTEVRRLLKKTLTRMDKEAQRPQAIRATAPAPTI